MNKYLDVAQFEASLEAAGANKTLTNDSIGMLFGIVAGVTFMFLGFIYLSYYFPWYEWFLTTLQFYNVSFCNCLYCYYYCCRDLECQVAKSARCQRKKSIFVQDMFAAPNGNIIHSSDVRPMCSQQLQQQHHHPIDMYNFQEI
jgi:hypothetical protein